MTSPAASAPPPLHAVLVAEAASLSVVRRSLRSWLGTLPLTIDDTADLVLAVHEAAENVVEHAYATFAEPGEVRVHAEVRIAANGIARVRATVADNGRWRLPPQEPGYRGRGMQMMRACTDSVRVNSTASGTRVTMTGRPFRIPNIG